MAIQQRIVLLNGPAGVGKTTVGTALASLVPNGVCIHGDHLAGFIVSRVAGQVESGLGYKNGATVAVNFIEAGYELVVFEYVFERPGNVDRFLRAFRARSPVHLFTLWAPLDVILDRERTRTNREPLGDRVAECYRSIESNLGRIGERVDTAEMRPDHIAGLIHHQCMEGRGLVSQRQPQTGN